MESNIKTGRVSLRKFSKVAAILHRSLTQKMSFLHSSVQNCHRELTQLLENPQLCCRLLDAKRERVRVL